MRLDPAAPLKDNGKPSYSGVDPKQRTRYCGFYAHAREPCSNRAEQHQNAGREASTIADGFRERGCTEQAIRWHLQDAWHHHASLDWAKTEREMSAAVVGEVDAWGAVAHVCWEAGEAEASGTAEEGGAASADERLAWLQRRCAYYHRAMLASERPGGGAEALSKRASVLLDLGRAVIGLMAPLDEGEEGEEGEEGGEGEKGVEGAEGNGEQERGARGAGGAGGAGSERSQMVAVRATLELECVRQGAVELLEQVREIGRA